MENKIAVLMKFGIEENLKSIQSGKLYCKRLGYYADLEKDIGDNSMGDKKEGKHYMTQCNFELRDPYTHELKGVIENSKCYIEIGETTKMPVFCMFGLEENKMELIEENEEQSVYNLNPKEVFKDIIKEDYWNSALIITEPITFLSRIIRKCEEDNIDVAYRSVSYTDMEINYEDRERSVDEEFANVAFWKDNKFKGQCEFRIIFKNIRVEDCFILDIGDISDITILLDNKKLLQFLDDNYQIIAKHEKVNKY